MFVLVDGIKCGSEMWRQSYTIPKDLNCTARPLFIQVALVFVSDIIVVIVTCGIIVVINPISPGEDYIEK